MIGLRFLLNYGHFLQIAISEQEAKQIMQGWSAGTLRPILQGTSPPSGIIPGVAWSIRTECIVAIHTFDLELLEQQRPQAGVLPWPRSGMN